MPPLHSEDSLRGSRLLASFALCAAFAAPAVVSAVPPGEPKTVAELVPLVQAIYKGVQTVRADFTQTAVNAMTGVEEKQRGRLLLERPRKYRVEIGLPLKAAVVGDGTTQWLYTADTKQVIVQKELGTGGGPVQLIDDLGRLNDLFDATLAPASSPPKPFYQLTLKPKTAGAVREMNVTLRKQTYHLSELNITDTTGAITRMSFSAMVLGGDIPDLQFSFKAPLGVTVVQMP